MIYYPPEQEAAIAASLERFADLRRISSIEEIQQWIFDNSALLYENGRVHGPWGAPIALEPTWTFKNLRFNRVSMVINEDRQECSATMLFTIHGTDPMWTIRRMFTGTGIELSHMAEGWHDYRAEVRLPPDVFSSLFVRRKLESLGD